MKKLKTGNKFSLKSSMALQSMAKNLLRDYMYSLKALRARLECVRGSQRCQLNKETTFQQFKLQRKNNSVGR